MFTATKIESTIKPPIFEPLNNGVWYYNYDIESEVRESNTENQLIYKFLQVRIQGKPTYDNCVKAIIGQYIDKDRELNLINSYNSYQLDIDNSNTEYEQYLYLLKEIKEKVRMDFSINKEVSVQLNPRQSDIIKLILLTINNLNLTDQQSLSVKSLYPKWEEFIGSKIEALTKIQYNGKLFKVVQSHLVQKEYPPSIDSASLYTEIIEEYQGTLYDPIPYPEGGNIIIYKDKYYIEQGVIYKCIRNSENPLYSDLLSLVGIYVEKVEELF